MPRPSAIEHAARDAMASIRGEAAAKSVVARARAGLAVPDALLQAFEALQGNQASQRGFLRAVQKVLER